MILVNWDFAAENLAAAKSAGGMDRWVSPAGPCPPFRAQASGTAVILCPSALYSDFSRVGAEGSIGVQLNATGIVLRAAEDEGRPC